MKKQIDKEILLINWGYVGPIRVNNGKLPSIKITNWAVVLSVKSVKAKDDALMGALWSMGVARELLHI